jgi:hypothetical protein
MRTDRKQGLQRVKARKKEERRKKDERSQKA